MTAFASEAPPNGVMPFSPYLGLRAYSEEDAAYFFGREADTRIIVANLYAARLTILYGASGVGKSSVLRAGVTTHLRRRADQPLVVLDSWRDEPLVALKLATARELARVLERTDVDADKPLDELVKDFADVLPNPVLFTFDQFEDYLLYHPEHGDQFALQFARAVNDPDCPIRFLISIRDDALSQLDRFEARIPSLFDNYLRLDRLDAAAARHAIQRPLDVLNETLPAAERASVEPQLVDAVIDQVRTGALEVGRFGGGQPHATRAREALIALQPENADGIGKAQARGTTAPVRVEAPYLQLVMHRLWDEESRLGSHTLRLETLQRLGGASRIVRTHLDTAMVALKPKERDISASIFYYMITPGGSKVAHTASDLADYAAVAPQRAQEVLQHLAEPNLRIVRPVPPAPGSSAATRFEIFHDVLASAILDWRARYLSRSALSARLSLAALGVLLVGVAVQFIPAFPAPLLTLLRGTTSIVLNALALLQLSHWFFRYLRFERGAFAALSERRPSLVVVLSLLLSGFLWATTNWTSPGFEELGNVPTREFVAWSVGGLALTLLIGAIGFLLMRLAGLLTDRLVKRFEVGFYGVYLVLCVLIVTLAILAFIGVFPRFIRFENTSP